MTLKNLVSDSKLTEFNLAKLINNLNTSMPSPSDLIHEMDQLYKREQEFHVRETTESLKHSFKNQRTILEKRNYELLAELE
jgi:hypothetical protein